VIGPQERFFAADAQDRLCTEPFIATGTFDRMGRALEGPPLLPLRLDMPSEPALPGCLQLTGDGRMTMLMADHQTTGGYPKIAAVIGADIDRLAQLEAGTAFRFETVSLDEAVRRRQKLASAQADALRQLVPGDDLAARLLGNNLVGGVIDALGAALD
jgi:allophanate hydrolase